MAKMNLTTVLSQPAVPSFWSVMEAVESMGNVGLGERRPIGTRREMVEFISDLVRHVESDLASLKSFVTSFAAHIAAEAART